MPVSLTEKYLYQDKTLKIVGSYLTDFILQEKAKVNS